MHKYVTMKITIDPQFNFDIGCIKTVHICFIKIFNNTM